MQELIRKFLTPVFLFVPILPLYNAESATKAPILDGTLAPASDYPYVGLVSVADSICTGTLITPNHVLTAAHCFFDENNHKITNVAEMSVILNNHTYKVAKVTVNPNYVSRDDACLDGETDASIIQLKSAVSGISPVPLKRSKPTVGTQLLLVGFGVQGSGTGGEDDTFPEDGYVNYGYTSIESVDSSYVNWVFDSNASESNTGGGDSGGPAFVDIDGVRYIDSITCGGTGNAGFRTTSSNTRADIIASWVDSVTGSSSGDPTPPSADSTLGVDSVVVNLYDDDAYTLLIKGKLTTAKALTPNKLTIKVGTAGVNTSVKLDKNGSWKSKGWDYMKFAGKVSGGKFATAKVSYTLALGDADKLYNKLATLLPEDAANGDIVEFPLSFTISKVTYTKSVNLKYNESTGIWKSVR